MVQGIPYVHWKIKDSVDLADIDPVYLWGTVIETDKGPLDTPVFCTDAEQVKRIFNYDLGPFFANGGRSVVVIRAYAGQPKKATFEFTLDEAFKYAYADYDYYAGTDLIKAKVNVVTTTVDTERPQVANKDKKYQLTQTAAPEGTTTLDVVFSDGRWRNCDANGKVKYFYFDKETVPATETEAATTKQVIKEAVVYVDSYGNTSYYPQGTTLPATGAPSDVEPLGSVFMKSFNESDVTKIIVAKIAEASENSPVIKLETIYPGDFLIPVSVQTDIRSGYRVSITESEDYSILLSGATTLEAIIKRINERASNIIATLTDEGAIVQKPFKASLIPVKDANGDYVLDPLSDSTLSDYDAYVKANNIPVGSIFAKRPADDSDESENYEFKLVETVTYLADGSNGVWDKNLERIANPATLQNKQMIAAAHKEALDHLANIKLAGIFCNYGEDEIQKVYADHVSTTEPQGMNSAEVCKWRTLILGANAFDRTNDGIGDAGFKMVDKAVAFDNENILFLGQGLIDTGYAPKSNNQVLYDAKGQAQYADEAETILKYVPLLDEDDGALPGQLLPFQCTQYVAGLRSKLFYGDAIFGGESKKEIMGMGTLSIAPLFAGENKILWQPDNYVYLNEHGVLTFTNDYNQLSLLDGVTTRQSPLEEDEEGVQSIIKYAKHAVHEELQTFIGRNLTDDLQIIMENSVSGVLSNMQSQDQTLISIPAENISAYDVNIVLVPKTNAQQILAKAYVYLTLTPVHALRQIEVELTVQ